MSDTNEMVTNAPGEFDAILPDGWTGEGDFFDESTWGDASATPEADNGADIGDNDLAPTTEPEVEEAEGNETESTEAPTTEQSQSTPSKLRFGVKIDHELRDVELDEAELPTIYQKAFATDRAQEKLAKYQPTQEKGDKLAALLGFDSIDDMLDSAEQNYLNNEIEKLTDEGVHPEVAKDIVTRRVQAVKPQPAANTNTTNAQNSDERNFAGEVAGLLDVHPELKGKRLPDEVVQDCVRNKRPLVQAYTDYESRQRKAEAEALRKENKTLKQNAEAARRAPVRGVSGSGVASEPDDPFLAGFNSDGW